MDWAVGDMVPDVVLDRDGPALLVGGMRFALDVARLRFLSRRAAAVAAATDGLPDDDPPVHEQPFARVGMPRLPVEAGIPSDMMADELSPATKLVWVQAWREVPHLLGKPLWCGRVNRLAKTLRIKGRTARYAFDELDAAGWATPLGRMESPASYGENRVLLHQQRRLDAPGTIDATAVDASSVGVKSDE